MGAEKRRRLQQEVWCRDGVILGVGFGEEEERVKICIWAPRFPGQNVLSPQAVPAGVEDWDKAMSWGKKV